MWVAVPKATPWTLVDHGVFWVAYRSARTNLLRVSKGNGSYRFRVAFLDDRGRVLRERAITGGVAG